MGGGVDRQLAAGIPGSDAPYGFQIGMNLQAGFKSFLQNEIRFPKSLVRIPPHRQGLGGDIILRVLMNPRSSRFHRFLRVKDGGQFFIFHPDQGQSFLGRLLIGRRHGRHFIPDIKSFIFGKNQLILDAGAVRAELFIRRVRRRGHGSNPHEFFRPAGIDV